LAINFSSVPGREKPFGVQSWWMNRTDFDVGRRFPGGRFACEPGLLENRFAASICISPPDNCRILLRF
jgi:hypothetical protein